MDRPEKNTVAATTHEVVERPYTDRSNGTRDTMNDARAGTVGADRRPWVERALVPALLGGIFSIAGWFALHVSAQTRELRAEVGDIRSELGVATGRLDGVDQRFDGVDQRFDAVDQRFDAVDQRFDAVDQRFDAVDQRLDGLDQRIDSLRDDMNERFARLEDRMGRIEALLMAQRSPPNSGL